MLHIAKPKKIQDYFLIICSIILLGIISIILFLIFSRSHGTVTTSNLQPSPAAIPSESPPFVLYDEAAQARLLEKAIHPPLLSQSDKDAKATVLSYLPQNQTSGIVFTSQNVILEYVHSADEFTAEITSTDIDQAKADVNSWLRSKGLSQQGICDLPVLFYLDPPAIQYLHKTRVIFSPLPNGC